MSTQNQSGQSKAYAVGLTVLSMAGRLVPHVPNVTPVGASSLFAGSRIGGYLAYLLPVAVMAATDPIVGHAGGASGGYSFGSPLIYASLMINVFIGQRLVRNVSAMRVGVSAFLCSLQFFLITNFAVWLETVRGVSHFYAPTFAGLMTCYIDALPFWGRTLAGDLFYSAALFGIYAWLARRVPAAESRVAA
jgi:hypothetical protein